METLALLKSVGEVATLAAPDDPTSASQRAFDRERERNPDHAALPPARRITERLGLSWANVLTIAHAPEAEQSKLLGLKNKAPSSAGWLTEKHLAAILQIAAARLGADTVSMTEYDAEHRKIVAADHARPMHGRILLIPTAQQIEHAAGSWGEALRMAGLRDQRKPGATRKKTNAPPLVDLMERFYVAHGVQPTARALEAWARASKIPYPNKGAGNVFSEAKEAWIERYRVAGVPDPKPAPHGRGRRGAPRPDYTTKKGSPLPGERRGDLWGKDSCVAAVARYIAQLPPGKCARSGSRGYRAWRAEQDHAPEMSTIQYHCGSWEEARRAALKLPSAKAHTAPMKP